MSGPCLCGDPYCGSCGNPYAAEMEAAEESVMEAFAKEFQSVEEYKLALEVGLAAVRKHREILAEIVTERSRQNQEYISYLNDRIRLLEAGGR